MHLSWTNPYLKPLWSDLGWKITSINIPLRKIEPYIKNRGISVSLLKKEKRKYYNNLVVNIFDDNRKFWKGSFLIKDIMLVEGNIITTNKKEVAEKLNNFFVDAVTHLEIEPYMPEDMDIIPRFTIDDIIERYKYHPSRTKIKENVKTNTKFLFCRCFVIWISRRNRKT